MKSRMIADKFAQLQVSSQLGFRARRGLGSKICWQNRSTARRSSLWDRWQASRVLRSRARCRGADRRAVHGRRAAWPKEFAPPRHILRARRHASRRPTRDRGTNATMEPGLVAAEPAGCRVVQRQSTVSEQPPHHFMNRPSLAGAPSRSPVPETHEE